MASNVRDLFCFGLYRRMASVTTCFSLLYSVSQPGMCLIVNGPEGREFVGEILNHVGKRRTSIDKQI